MKNFKVRLTIYKNGRRCASCKQEFSGTFYAKSAEDAVKQAKDQSGANPESHQFLVNYVRSE